MTLPVDPPLESPPRKVHLRRGTRNLRRAYRVIFVLILAILVGWIVLDLFHWNELELEQRLINVGFAIAGVIAFVVLRFVELPFARELRLGKLGYVASGEILTVGPPRGRRALVTITYAFTTVAGDKLNGRCTLNRSRAAFAVEPGLKVEVLYDPANPGLNRPRFALEFVEFGDPR
jgi:hypothetical protein